MAHRVPVDLQNMGAIPMCLMCIEAIIRALLRPAVQGASASGGHRKDICQATYAQSDGLAVPLARGQASLKPAPPKPSAQGPVMDVGAPIDLKYNLF